MQRDVRCELQHFHADPLGLRSEAGRPLGEVVRQLTSERARAVGFFGWGVIAPALRTDLNLIDLERLRLHSPRVAYDHPAGGKRLTQDAEGYVLTMVAGIPIYREGNPTGELPDRLSVPTTLHTPPERPQCPHRRRAFHADERYDPDQRR